MHEVLVNRLGGLSLPRKSVVRLTDRPDMTLDVYHGRKTTMQQQQPKQPQRSRSILQDGSRSLGLFWTEKKLRLITEEIRYLKQMDTDSGEPTLIIY